MVGADKGDSMDASGGEKGRGEGGDRHLVAVSMAAADASKREAEDVHR